MTTPVLLCGVLVLLCLRAVIARAASRANADLPKRHATPFHELPVTRKV